MTDLVFGRNPQRTESEVRQLAPNLLAAYEIQRKQPTGDGQPSSDFAPEASGVRMARTASSGARNYRDESDSDDAAEQGSSSSRAGRPQRAATKRQKGKKTSRDSSPEPDDSADETADEPSSQGSDSASGGEEEESDDDDNAAYSSTRTSSRAKGKQREVQGTRRSNRDAAQTRKKYNFGSGDGGSDDDDDEEDSLATSEIEPEKTTTTRSGRISKRAGAASTPSSDQYKDVGNSSDELSIQAGSREPSEAAKRAARAAAEEEAAEAEEDELAHDSLHAESDFPARQQDLHRGVSSCSGVFFFSRALDSLARPC